MGNPASSPSDPEAGEPSLEQGQRAGLSGTWPHGPAGQGPTLRCKDTVAPAPRQGLALAEAPSTLRE